MYILFITENFLLNSIRVSMCWEVLCHCSIYKELTKYGPTNKMNASVQIQKVKKKKKKPNKTTKKLKKQNKALRIINDPSTL